MWLRRFFTVLIAVLFGLWDATIAPWFPGLLATVTFSLPFVTVLATFSREERAITAAIASGIMLDIFLPSNAGFVSVRYLIIAMFIFLLQQRLFTNRSLIAVSVLGAIACVSDRLLLLVFTQLQHLLGRTVIPEASSPLLAEVAWIVFVMAITFLLFAAFSKRFLPLVSRTGWSKRTPSIH